MTSHLGRLDGNFDSESLEVNDDGKDGDGSKEVHNVWEPLPVESLFESSGLVVPGEEEVEEGDNGTLKFWTSTRVDSVGGEGFPNDRLANVGRDKEGDTRTETVAFGQELVEEDDNKGSGDELEYEQKTDTWTEGRRRSVETGENVDGGLTEGNDKSKDWD